MKKTGLILLCAFFYCSTVEANPRWGSGFDEADLDLQKNAVQFREVDSSPVTPPPGEIKVYAKNDSGTTKVFTIDGNGTEQALGAGGGAGGLTQAQVLARTTGA